MTPQELVRMKEIRLWLIVLVLIGVIIGVGLAEVFHATGWSSFTIILIALAAAFGAAVVNSRR